MSLKDDSSWEWLESPLAPECLEWVAKENEITSQYMDSLAVVEDVKARLNHLTKINKPCPKFYYAGHIFRYRKDSERKHGILEVTRKKPNGILGGWETVIDLDELSKTEGKSYELILWLFTDLVLPGTFDRILLPLSNGGSDLVEIREYDIFGRNFVEGGFHTAAGRNMATWLDLNHLLIGHTLNNSPTTSSHWPAAVYIWKRGTELKDAKCVYISPLSYAFNWVASVRSAEDRQGIIVSCPSFSTQTFQLVSLDGAVDQVLLPATLSGSIVLPTTQKHIVSALSEPWSIRGKNIPTGTLIAYDTSAGIASENRVSIVYIPEEDEIMTRIVIGGLSCSLSRVQAIYNKRQTEQIKIFACEDNSWKLVEQTRAPIGSNTTVTCADPYTNDIIVTQSGPLEPECVWLESGEDGFRSKVVLHEQPKVFNGDDFQANLYTASSKDGTAIDYLFMSPKKPKHTIGNAPVLMTGYGGFNTSFNFEYLNQSLGGISLVPWLEAGGSLVVPLIRGGGERGAAWHRAAMKERRQNSYDDFIAVAETLIQKGYAPKHIGVFGASHGGLLAAVMGTMRPDLFSAVLVDVPLTDMLRYPHMGMGAVNVDEYGDPEDPEAAKALLAYSPFHNIKKGLTYPTFFVTVSTTDDRVGPGHARKFVAKLKDAGIPDVFLFEDREGGHDVSDPYKNADLISKRMAFFMERLL